MKAKFGRYVFLRKIAVGGMAEIFLARRLSFGGFAKFVVIKRLLPEHRGRRAYENLFLTEARTAAVLNHPNVVSLHDLGKLDDAYFMAMEYVHGVSGAQLMADAARARKPLPLGVALRIVGSVAEALHYCFQTPDLDGRPLRILHHDVTPHNVQISYDGDVKLLDFGVATRMDEPAPGGRRGKFAYMSPEAMARAKDLDQRSDVYSLGVVLFELSLGRRLFKGSDTDDTKKKARAGLVTLPTAIDGYYPQSLEEIVVRALHREREQRYPSARAFGDALWAAARKLGVDTSTEALGRFLRDLYGDTIAERRAELWRLAQASDPRPAGTPAPDGTPAPGATIQPPAESIEAPLDEPRSAPESAEATPSPVPEIDEAAAAAQHTVSLNPADAPPVSAPEEEPPDRQQTPSPLPEVETGVTAPGDALPAGFQPSAPPEELPPNADGADEDWDKGVDTAAAPRSDDAEPGAGGSPGAVAAPTPPPSVAPASSGGRGGLWLVLALVGLIGAFFAGRLAGGGPDGYSLTVRSDPSGVRVYDGEHLLGMTPVDRAPAEAGQRFELRIEHQGFAPWRQTVEVTPDAPHPTVNVQLSPAGGS